MSEPPLLLSHPVLSNVVLGVGRVDDAAEALHLWTKPLGPCTHHVTQLSLRRIVSDDQGTCTLSPRTQRSSLYLPPTLELWLVSDSICVVSRALYLFALLLSSRFLVCCLTLVFVLCWSSVYWLATSLPVFRLITTQLFYGTYDWLTIRQCHVVNLTFVLLCVIFVPCFIVCFSSINILCIFHTVEPLQPPCLVEEEEKKICS